MHPTKIETLCLERKDAITNIHRRQNEILTLRKRITKIDIILGGKALNRCSRCSKVFTTEKDWDICPDCYEWMQIGKHTGPLP